MKRMPGSGASSNIQSWNGLSLVWSYKETHGLYSWAWITKMYT